MVGASTLWGKSIHVHEGISPMDEGIALSNDAVVDIICVA